MNFNFIEESSKKIGIFTDCHFGVAKDAQFRLKQTEKCFDWIIKTFKQQKVDYIIFCGDLFDSRFSINVQTLNSAITQIQNLAYNFEKVFLIVGNHDTYYKNVNTMNSINFLAKLSKTNNIHIIQEDPYFLKIGTKTLGLFPWGFNPDILNSIQNYKKCDYGFGHFECNGIELAGQISSGASYAYKDLFKAAHYMFSGHYHNNKVYSSGKHTLLMVGSSLQLNWSDYNKNKYIYTLDLSNNNLQSFQNIVNARFQKIYYSRLEADKYTKSELTKLCKHNFIKFVIDKKYQFNDILSFTEKLKQFKPISIELEYLISLTSDIIMQSTDDIIKSNSKDNLSYLIEYIEKVFNQVKDTNNDINLDTLKQLTCIYYKKSQITEAERQDKVL